ncbi:hypothetical protein ABPG72_010108 [Tetrahymena utriculariae]
MNNNRYFKEEKSKSRKQGPRVYTYQNKEISSIQQQIVVDLSQSSYSQSQNLHDEDSIYTFCQSQNKKQAQQFSTQSVSISVENSLDNNLQLKGYQNSFQSSVSIKVSSSNNQPKPNKNRGKSENNKNNNPKSCASLKSIADSLSVHQDKSASISSISFSNSIKFEPDRNKFYTSTDSVNPSNKRLTRSTSQNQNQIILNNIFSGMQHIKDKMIQQNTSSNTSSRIAKNLITKGTGAQTQNKSQNNIFNCNKITDSDICQIEKTKYKQKDYDDSQGSVEASKINFLSGAASTTQPKQRKNEKNYSQENELDGGDDDDELHYLSLTAKTYDNRLANQNRLVFADEKDYKNHYQPQNQKMFDESQKPSFKIVKRSNSIFNEKAYPKNDIIYSSYVNQGTRKVDSAQTSVTQCKEQIERNQSSKLFEKSLNGAKKAVDRVPFFIFDGDEDEDIKLSNKLSSSKSQDETHLNIDDQNIWNKNSCQNFNSSKKNQYQQNNKLDFFNIKQLNHQNIWNHDQANQTESIDLNQMFQKKIKNSQQNNKYFGVDDAFTIDYEKLRYTSQNNKRKKHYEFNCFNDKDLRIPQKFQKKIQELTLDDDNQTDDETLDHYVGVCFNDLLIGIEMNKLESEQFDGQSQSNSCSSNCEKSSKKTDPLWRYFKPPNHCGTVEA